MKTEYTDSQYSSNYPDGVERHWWNLVRNRFIHRLVRGLEMDRPAIIEIGCGRGIVVDDLCRRGVDCAGVELADVRPMPGAEQHIQTGISAVDLPLPQRQRYDVIMLLDVLEHLPNPAEFLRSMLAAFPNARSVIVTVPACPELWSNYDEHYGHFMRYTMRQLDALMRSCGLSPVVQGHFFHSVYPVALLGAKLKRDREIDVAAPKGWARWLHKLVAWALMLDARLVPARVRGTSAYAVCRVPER